MGGGEPRPIATTAAILEGRETIVPIGRTPLQQAGAATAGDGLDVSHGITEAVQAHRLTAHPKRAVLGLEFGGVYGGCIRRAHAKNS